MLSFIDKCEEKKKYNAVRFRSENGDLLYLLYNCFRELQNQEDGPDSIRF